MKGKNKISAGVMAGLLALLLHGLAFSVPAYLMYGRSKGIIQNTKTAQKQNTIQVELAVLPSVSDRGNESVIRQAQGEKQEEQGRDGLGAPAERQGSADADREMLTYQDAIKQRIQQARQYPSDAKRAGIEGAVEMAFTVLRHGVIKAVEVTSGSGSSSLDEEAVATIKRASPFPELPQPAGGNEMTMRVKLVFNIE